MIGPWSPMNPWAWASRARKVAQVAGASGVALRHRPRFPVTMLDVGARGGPIGEWGWAHRLGLARLLLVEPEPAEAARLRRSWPKATVLEVALGPTSGQRTLHVTAEPGRSSFLRPLHGEGPYAVEREILVDTAPLDEVIDEAVDFVKIDVQGFELEVLEGFGTRLDQVLGLEVEVAFEPAYAEQPDVGVVNLWMLDHGFVPLDLRPFGPGGRVWEANAYYARADALADPRVRFWRRLRGMTTPSGMLHRL